MTADSEQRKTSEVTEDVADEGNVPGPPSSSATLAVLIIVLIAVGLIYLASTYAPSQLPRATPHASAQ
jgi:hypothetical protein